LHQIYTIATSSRFLQAHLFVVFQLYLGAIRAAHLRLLAEDRPHAITQAREFYS
jgi:hypothetical protein